MAGGGSELGGQEGRVVDQCVSVAGIYGQMGLPCSESGMARGGAHFRDRPSPV